MTITFVAAGTAAANALSITVVAPACAAGDLLIASIGVRNGTTTLTVPSGWSLAVRGTTSPSAAFYTKVATSADSGASFTFSSSTATISGAILAYRGASAVDASAASASTSGTSVTAPAVTTTKANEFVLELFVAIGTFGTTSVTPPATSRVTSTAGSSSSVAWAVSDQSQAAAGTSAPATATASGGNPVVTAAATISLAGASALGHVIVGGVKKNVAAMSVIVGGVKKPVTAATVIVGGVKKPLA